MYYNSNSNSNNYYYFFYHITNSIFFQAECCNDIPTLRCVHGIYENGFCICNKGWYGTHCEYPACSGGCRNGKCVLPGICKCRKGFKGKHCEESICNPQCMNGTCEDDGTCKYEN